MVGLKMDSGRWSGHTNIGDFYTFIRLAFYHMILVYNSEPQPSQVDITHHILNSPLLGKYTKSILVATWHSKQASLICKYTILYMCRL